MSLLSKLFIKGMVCQRCIAVVRSELEGMGLTPHNVELGAVTVISAMETVDTQQVAERLHSLGFELLEDRKLATVQKLKDLIATVYSGDYDFPEHFRFSDLVVKHLSKDYDAVSALFALVEHKTLEQYIIHYRIEKAKEFLVYENKTLSDISFQLNYSSVAHLSRQFRQITGLTPSHFREIKREKREQEIQAKSVQLKTIILRTALSNYSLKSKTK